MCLLIYMYTAYFPFSYVVINGIIVYYASGSVAFSFTSDLVNTRKILFEPTLIPCLCTTVTLQTRRLINKYFCKV